MLLLKLLRSTEVLLTPGMLLSSCAEPIKQKHPKITYANLYQVIWLYLQITELEKIAHHV